MPSHTDAIPSIAPSFSADLDLEHRVRASLAAHRRPALGRLSIEARNGAVTLRGEVPSYYEKQLGAATVRRIAEVRTFIDAIDVIAWPMQGVGK